MTLIKTLDESNIINIKLAHINLFFFVKQLTCHLKVKISICILIENSKDLVNKKFVVSIWHNFIINFCNFLLVQLPIWTIVGKSPEKIQTQLNNGFHASYLCQSLISFKV